MAVIETFVTHEDEEANGILNGFFSWLPWKSRTKEELKQMKKFDSVRSLKLSADSVNILTEHKLVRYSMTNYQVEYEDNLLEHIKISNNFTDSAWLLDLACYR